MGKGKGAPDPPDYAAAVEKQTKANRANQTGPYASSQWTQGPNGQWSQNVGFNGPLAGLNDKIVGSANEAFSTPLDTGEGARNKAEEALYGRATSRLDPMFGKREHDLSVQLANQGIDMNSQAYQGALANEGRNRNDAYSSAMREAIMGGGAEGERTQRMDLARRISAMGALQNMQGLSGMPGIPGAGNYLGAAQAQGQYAMDNARLQQDFIRDLISGAGQYVAAVGA